MRRFTPRRHRADVAYADEIEPRALARDVSVVNLADLNGDAAETIGQFARPRHCHHIEERGTRRVLKNAAECAHLIYGSRSAVGVICFGEMLE